MTDELTCVCACVLVCAWVYTGDPIESAAMKAVEWAYDARSNTSRPGNWGEYAKAVVEVQKELTALGYVSFPPIS